MCNPGLKGKSDFYLQNYGGLSGRPPASTLSGVLSQRPLTEALSRKRGGAFRGSFVNTLAKNPFNVGQTATPKGKLPFALRLAGKPAFRSRIMNFLWPALPAR
ncbi:MAG: hypothetical protein CM15mP103_06320 [Gammaproteobacteria bacterium]|nr:MAG: hypothetical protein CM15mP103_06320 [Gammaproteobacteria bacterium]